MKRADVVRAVEEAQKFVNRANKLLILHTSPDGNRLFDYLDFHSAESASVKRQSMELTRALSAMRRSR